jgi:transcriptional regulator with PAS, ATPase and Fis domain
VTDNGNGISPIVGASEAITRLVDLARRIAPTNLPVLLVGPTGCGKELFAQHIHRWSGRPGAPLAINCAALPEQLVESELFGHDGQAYTGARRAKPGLIELAEHRSFFLDEILSLPLNAQAKLLRVVETGELWRVGETKPRRVDVRYVAAAQEDLHQRVSDGRFRADLLQRLAGIVLRIPPLAERREDVIPLARFFAQKLGRTLEREAELVLADRSWPGNVREVKHTVDRAARLAAEGPISATALVESMTLGISQAEHARTSRDAQISPAEVSLEDLRAVCEACTWNSDRIAGVLGLGRTTLFKLLRAQGVSLRSLRRAARFTSVRERSRTLVHVDALTIGGVGPSA